MITPTKRSNKRERGGTMFTKKLWAAMVMTMMAALTVPLASPASAQASYDLCATTGSVTMPDATVVPVWSYVLGDCTTAPVPASLPGAELHVPAGSSLTINLHVDSTMGENVSLVVPTLTGAPDVTGVGPGSSTSYSWAAGELSPGTHLYESGVNPGVQIPMGLYGAIVIEDAAPVAAVDQVVLMSDLDVDLNNSVDPNTFDRTDYAPEYFLINGQAAPDIPDLAATPGQTVRLRYVNAGARQSAMAILGARQTVVAKEGRPLPLPRNVVSELIPSGHTVDVDIVMSNEQADSRVVIYNRNGYLSNDVSSDSEGGMQFGINVAGAPATYVSINCGPSGGANTCWGDSNIYRVSNGAMELVFDGSQVMATTGTIPTKDPIRAMIDGFAFLSPTEILISFQRPVHRTVFGLPNVAGVPAVIDDSDVMLFTATSLGATTSGTWSWYFDGSDVELTLGVEDIDALDVLPDGSLLLSTVATATTAGGTFNDEDVFRFEFASTSGPGADVDGTYSLYLDGSEMDGANGTGLKATSEDIDALSVDEVTGDLHLSTLGNINVNENVAPLAGQDDDVVSCIVNSGLTTCSTWQTQFDGASLTLQAYDVKAVEVSSLPIIP